MSTRYIETVSFTADTAPASLAAPTGGAEGQAYLVQITMTGTDTARLYDANGPAIPAYDSAEKKTFNLPDTVKYEDFPIAVYAAASSAGHATYSLVTDATT